MLLEKKENFLNMEAIMNRDSIETKMLLEEIRKIKISKNQAKSLKFFDFKLMKHSLSHLEEELTQFDHDIDGLGEYVKTESVKEKLKKSHAKDFKRQVTEVKKANYFIKSNSFSVNQISDLDRIEFKARGDALHNKILTKKKLPQHLLRQDFLDVATGREEVGKMTSINDNTMDEEA